MSNYKNRQVEFTVLGEPASKANSRRLVQNRGRARFIKSEKALEYVATFQAQCLQLEEPLAKDVAVTIDIHYASRRPDLDESVILDCMQSQYVKNPLTGEKVMTFNGVYLNDRQVKEKHIYWHLDKNNPRAKIMVKEIG